MISWVVPAGLALMLSTAAPPGVETAADAVTLRDGTVVLGQVAEPSPRGTLQILVRRDWAEAKLPDRAQRWRETERPVVRRAQAQRRERLKAWRRARADVGGKDDRINIWIDAQLDRLTQPDAALESPLMLVRLNRGEVRGILRRPRSSAHLLLLGWQCGFSDVESMPLDDLKQALEGRGFTIGSNEPVSVQDLLPEMSETEEQWLLRRAATEVVHDAGLRFVRFGSAVIPEPESGQALDAGLAASALSDLARLLSGNAADPLPARLHGLAGKGKVGAVLTRLEISPEMASVQVETALLVRIGPDRWMPARSRSAIVRPDDLGPNAGDALADDPQVRAAIQLVESLGLGPVPPELKQRSLNIGAATQKALGLARSALQDDLSSLVFPVAEPPRPKAEAKPVAEPKPCIPSPRTVSRRAIRKVGIESANTS
jgi:hypothetical protein